MAQPSDVIWRINRREKTLSISVMPHVEKCIYRSEADSPEPPLKKLRPGDFLPWTDNDTNGQKEHFMTRSHDVSISPIPGKCMFEQKYRRNSNISSEDSQTAIKRFDSDTRIRSRHLNDKTEGISRHTSGCASSEDDYRVNAVNASGSEFSLTSRAFIGPLFPPRTENVARSSCFEDRPHAGSTSPCYKISTIELGKGTSRSKVNDGMDYELRQFYMELHQLEEETENIQVKTNEQQVSNAIQGPPCSSNPPKSIFVCSPEEYSVAPHNNPVSFSGWEEHLSNRANKPLLNTATPPRFNGPLPQPLTKSHGHQLQNGTRRESECEASNVVYEPFCTQRPLHCVFPNPQSSFNTETVWRQHNLSDRANNPPFMNTVPPRFHGPPPGVYKFQSNFPSQDIKPYTMYPENPNRYGCTEEHLRPNDCHQWNDLPPHQRKYGDRGDRFRETIYDDKRVSQHIDQNAYRPQETPLTQTPRTFSEQHLDVNKSSSDRPCSRCKRTLILLRGVPGSGKSTLARVLLGLCSDGLVFSTDDYFCQKEGYVYDVTLLGDAHDWNQNRAKRAMDDERSPIIIDNTNIQGWEMKPYVQMAIERDYVVEFLEPDTWWKLDPLELEKRNKHGVPRTTISKMLDRYEHDMTVLHVMNSVEPPHRSSSRQTAQPRQMCGASVNALQQRTTFHNR